MLFFQDKLTRLQDGDCIIFSRQTGEIAFMRDGKNIILTRERSGSIWLGEPTKILPETVKGIATLIAEVCGSRARPMNEDTQATEIVYVLGNGHHR